jgi:anti-sigma regulatory factor (Ser/Thr protein kinase)
MLPGHRFPASFSALPSLLAFIAEKATADVDAATLLRAQTAVEELFANSIHHGYGQESDAPVWLDVSLTADVLCIEYADAAPAFDPLAGLDISAHVIDDDGESARIGGVGRHLVRGLADQSSYRRTGTDENGRNEVSLAFLPREPGASKP